MGNLVRARTAVGFTAFALLALCGPAEGQQSAIEGTVTGQVNGVPIDGATVRIEGTDQGAFTGSDGSYRITDVQPGEVTILVSRLGFLPVERTVSVPAGETLQVDFQLATARISMEELVASVQAGAVQRRETGTDIAQINMAEEMETAAAAESFTDLLSGRGQNVQITQGSGQVGVGSRISIRSTTSLTQTNAPLVVIDGVRVSNETRIVPTDPNPDAGGPIDTGGQTTSRFEDLNPHDIESIEVVKGPTAATLYGSEAASGVLVITTKRGQERDAAITLRTTQGFQRDITEYPDNFGDLTTGFGVTDPNDPRLDGFRTAQNPVTGTVFAIDNPLEDEDSSPFQHGYQGSFAGSITGGSEDAQYYGSAEYQDISGVFAPNTMERVRGRANVAVQPSDVVDISISTGYVRHDLGLVDTSTRFGWVVQGVLGTPANSFGDSPAPGEGPCLFDVLTDGPPTGACTNRNGTFVTQFEDLREVEQREELNRFTGSVVGTITPNEWLTVNATGGIDQYTRRLVQLVPFDPQGRFGGLSRGLFTDVRQDSRTITGDGGATARFDLSDRLSSTTSGGVQVFARETEQTGCEGDTFSGDAINSCDGSLITSGFSDQLENVEVGAYGQQRFGWDGWLFGTVAVRWDDNSALGERADVIVSPSANASVVLSEAPFWTSDLFDVLRFRFAWGQASQSPDQFAADRTFVNAPTTVNGQPAQGLTPSDPGNPELKEETSEEFELGVDAELFQGRLSASLTYYDVQTTDAIVPVPVPPSSGFPNERFVNLATVENQGFEVTLDGRVLDRDAVDWDVRLSFSTTDPIVTDLGRDAPLFFPSADVGTTSSGSSQVFATGVAPGAYVSQVIASATRGPDGSITDFTLAPADSRIGSNRQVIGSPIVTNEQSLASTVTLFDRLRIFTLFDRDGGNDLLNTTEVFRSPLATASEQIPTSSFSERWAMRHTESPETQAEIEERFIRPFLEDGSFIRWRELTVSYDLPANIANLVSADRARLTLGGRNLALITDFSGTDPEANIQGGQDNFVRNVAFEVGVPQTFFGELSVTF